MRGWKLNEWVDAPYYFHNLGKGVVIKSCRGRNFQKMQFGSPLPPHKKNPKNAIWQLPHPLFPPIIIHSTFKWLSQWWLVFVLLWIDAVPGDGCGIWKYLHNFRRWGELGRVSPRFHCVTPAMKAFPQTFCEI